MFLGESDRIIMFPIKIGRKDWTRQVNQAFANIPQVQRRFQQFSGSTTVTGWIVQDVMLFVCMSFMCVTLQTNCLLFFSGGMRISSSNVCFLGEGVGNAFNQFHKSPC